MKEHAGALIPPEVLLATPPPVSHRTAEENLGLGYIAATLREADKRVKIIDGWLEGLNTHQMADEILNNPPSVMLGFSCYRSNMERTIEVASFLKDNGLEVPIIVGGFGPTFHDHEFLNAGFDIVVRGEAEDTIKEIYQYFTEGNPDISKIKGISYKSEQGVKQNLQRRLIDKIDEIPFPSRDTLRLTTARKTPAHILSSRGCEAHCAFCSVVTFQRLSEGPQWRQRSISNFVDELEEVTSMGVTHFKVIDDSFIEPPRDEKWCSDLADEIEGRELNLRLRGSIRADRVTDKIIAELKRAGFFSFSCGIENGSPSGLKRMGKSAKLEQNIEALEIFNKHSIIVQAGYILFDHRTTMKELYENYQFMRTYPWTISKGVFTEMYAAAGTPFTKSLKNLELLEEDPKGLGNNQYRIQDCRVKTVYNALKHWQMSHAGLYDMVIDPISAPKVLNEFSLNAFLRLAGKLKEKDLDFFGKVLSMVNFGATSEKVTEIVNRQITESQESYEEIKKKANHEYQIAGLVYDAEINPFLC